VVKIECVGKEAKREFLFDLQQSNNRGRRREDVLSTTNGEFGKLICQRIGETTPRQNEGLFKGKLGA
jgi:hypothetical protein